MGYPSAAYLRLKRYRERRSLEREKMYLAKEWPAGHEEWNAHRWAAVKRWFIYYSRRSQERQLGFPLSPRKSCHWVGRAEAERKKTRQREVQWNLAY